MEGMLCICNSCLTTLEIKRLKIGQELLLHTREGYCSLMAKVRIVSDIGAVGCEVTIEEILNPCTESTAVSGDVVWANFNDLAIIN